MMDWPEYRRLRLWATPTCLEPASPHGGEAIRLAELPTPATLKQPLHTDSRKSRDLTSSSTDFGHKNSTPGLLRLPPELRKIIYELALPRIEYIAPFTHDPSSIETAPDDETYYFAKHRGLMQIHALHPFKMPSLLQACRLLRLEALPMSYGHNVFLLVLYNVCGERYKRSLAWLKSTSARGVASIRHFIILAGVEVCLFRWEEGVWTDLSLILTPDSPSIRNTCTIRKCDVARVGCGHRYEMHETRRSVEGIKSISEDFLRRETAEKWDDGRYKWEMVKLFEGMEREVCWHPKMEGLMFFVAVIIGAIAISAGLFLLMFTKGDERRRVVNHR